MSVSTCAHSSFRLPALGSRPSDVYKRQAAAGYSSYGNQIGLATGMVAELYHPGYIAKRMEIGKALLVSDFCIALFAGGLYGVRTGLYCVLGLLAKAFVVDGVIEGINVRKKVTIVSRQPDKINEFIMGTLHRGATVYTAHGAFSGRDEQVITTVLNRREAVSLRNYIRRTDPGAFITIVNSSETIGKGFRAI